jgi:hypothetical protein
MKILFKLFLVLNIYFGFILFAQAQTKVDLQTSNLALKDILTQNPLVEPTDDRDKKLKFSELMAPYLNPGINTVYDDKTGESLTHFSFSTNSCELYENNNAFVLYYCNFAVGYTKDVRVDKYSKIILDMSLLLSSGVQVQYDYKIKPDASTHIENATYFLY